MKQNIKYSIGELADAAGISRRTVRFYVQTGVIPSPVGLGRFSYYTSEHLALIKSYRNPEPELQYDSMKSKLFFRSEGNTRQFRVVTHLDIASGVVLEIPEGINLPEPEQLEALKEIITRILFIKE